MWLRLKLRFNEVSKMAIQFRARSTVQEQEERLLNLIASRFNTDVRLLELDEDVFERLGVNSFQVLDALFSIETEFDVIIREDQIRNIRTIRDLVTLVT